MIIIPGRKPCLQSTLRPHRSPMVTPIHSKAMHAHSGAKKFHKRFFTLIQYQFEFHLFIKTKYYVHTYIHGIYLSYYLAATRVIYNVLTMARYCRKRLFGQLSCSLQPVCVQSIKQDSPASESKIRSNSIMFVFN